MVPGTVLKDIYTSLSALLQANVSELSASGSITSQSPAQINAGPGVILSIFPYQIHHNPFMANEQPVRVAFDTMHPAPLVLDTYYAFTPFSTTEYAELTVMEKIMGTFYDHSMLQGSDLKGNLMENGNDVLRVIPVEMNTDEINKLWSLFSKPYKQFVSYMVTPVKIPSLESSTFKRVVQKDIEFSYIEG